MPSLQEHDNDEDEDYTQQQRQGQNVLEDADNDTLRILLSTDNHLGYNERDPVRGMDSFAAFEEVLYLAKRFKCDLVLIAGDLFHDNRPSRRTLFITMELLRRYCMGPNAVRIQIISDQKQNFQSPFGSVNYQDEHYSIDLPVFSIHGNHDDPSRDAGGDLLAALDLLSVSNLVNYFGRQDQVDKIEISPVLIQKGITSLALYGLGSMRDERLNRMWQGKKVRFLRPEEDENNDEDGDDESNHGVGFFNLFTLHQNRDLGRGTKNCIQESMIPEWMDLVVWGHEHECLIDFFESVVGTFRITQPGSSVATSLVAGEAVMKKVGVLDIKGKNFRMHTVPLTHVRSFVTTELLLKEHKSRLDPEDAKIEEKMTKVLDQEVSVLILNAREKMQQVLDEARAAGNDAGDENSPLQYKLEKPNQVLVRIRVDHSGFDSISNQRFGARFVGEVANPTDILLFSRRKEAKAASSQTSKQRVLMMRAPIAPEALETVNMEDMVLDFLEAPERKLKLLNKKKLSEALEEYVDKNVVATISDTTAGMLKEAQKKLIADSAAAEHGDKASTIRDIIEQDSQAAERMQEEEEAKESESLTEAQRQQQQKAQRKRGRLSNVDENGEDEDNESVNGIAKNGGKGNSSSDESGAPSKRKSPVRRAGIAKIARTAPYDSQHKAARRRQLLEFDDDDDHHEVPKSTRNGSTKAKSVSKSTRPPTKSSGRPKRTTTARAKNYHDDDDVGDESDDVIDLDRGKHDEDDILNDDKDFDDEPMTRKRGARSFTQNTPSLRMPAGKTISARKSARKTTNTRKRRARLDSDDDDDNKVPNGRLTMEDSDDDWGTAVTRSQL